VRPSVEALLCHLISKSIAEFRVLTGSLAKKYTGVQSNYIRILCNPTR